MWTNLVSAYVCTMCEHTGHCSPWFKRKDNVLIVFQLQPTDDQHKAEEKQQIITLPCPTEVSNCTSLTRCRHPVLLQNGSQILLLFIPVCTAHGFFLLPPQAPALSADTSQLSFKWPQRCVSSASTSEYCLSMGALTLFLVVAVRLIPVSGQFTGTDMPCVDLSPSPSLPTSGKTLEWNERYGVQVLFWFFFFYV